MPLDNAIIIFMIVKKLHALNLHIYSARCCWQLRKDQFWQITRFFPLILLMKEINCKK